MKRGVGLTALVLLAATMVFGHGNEQHVMGAVTKVTDTEITVKTQDGRSIDVAITLDTKFTKGGHPISAKDVKQEDRVVIHARKNGEKLVATTVVIGQTKPTQSEKTAAQRH